MKLSQIKALLPTLHKLAFKLDKGTYIPEHFHVTEVGQVSRNFIDCGGTIRKEKTINFQLWYANDFEHRLQPVKLLNIIELAEKQLNLEDAEVEVEYQSDTIGRYTLMFDGATFILHSKSTACLAQDQCGIPQKKQVLPLSSLQTKQTDCSLPNTGCCQ